MNVFGESVSVININTVMLRCYERGSFGFVFIHFNSILRAKAVSMDSRCQREIILLSQHLTMQNLHNYQNHVKIINKTQAVAMCSNLYKQPKSSIQHNNFSFKINYQ